MRCPEPRPRLEKGADLKGCMVALHPDTAAAARLATGGEPAARLHVTLAYLGKAAGVDRATVDRVVAGWAATVPPLRAQVAGAGTFTNGDEPVAHLSIDAPGLERHRERLVDALERAGVPASGDHGFQPHMTIGYGDGADAAVQAARGKNPRLRFGSVRVTHAGAAKDHELSGRS